MQVVHCATTFEIASLVESATLPRFNPSDVETQHADIHLCALSGSGDVQARCSLWWNHVPAYEQHRVGVIGHYAAVSDDTAAVVLAAAEERLRATGCTLTIGPMNGNTWRSYRFVTERGRAANVFPGADEFPRMAFAIRNGGVFVAGILLLCA